jgi:hypothetical protein
MLRYSLRAVSDILTAARARHVRALNGGERRLKIEDMTVGRWSGGLFAGGMTDEEPAKKYQVIYMHSLPPIVCLYTPTFLNLCL